MQLSIASMKKILLLLAIIPFLANAQWQLSERAEIHVVTCGPYQGELYSAFGHSAIRVKDPEHGFDLLYNYGVFNFNQPHFYLNFARGYLYYKLSLSDYHQFVNYYISENRYVHEQVLNLSQRQKQELFNFLQWNVQPENMNYVYDYFYDNCATRVRDAVEKNVGDSVRFDDSYIRSSHSIRDLTDLYLAHQPWGDLGLDLCLGLPMDKQATPYEYMFLPDYLESGFEHAQLWQNGEWVPLVKEHILTYEARPEEQPVNWLTPGLVFSLVLLLGAWITYRGYLKSKGFVWFDIVLFSAVGLLGWLLLLLWLFTDHEAAAQNFNLLWAIPLHFPLVWLLLRKRKPVFLRVYFGANALLQIITLAGWAFWPQDLHNALLPLVSLILIRSLYIQFRIKKQKEEVSRQEDAVAR